MKKKTIVLILFALPILLLIIGFFFPENSARSTIRGTYQSEETYTFGQVQLTFESDNFTFFQYRDSQLVDSGNYQKSDDNIYLLKSELQDTYVILQADNSFYYYDTTLEDPEMYHMHLTTTVPGYYMEESSDED